MLSRPFLSFQDVPLILHRRILVCPCNAHLVAPSSIFRSSQGKQGVDLIAVPVNRPEPVNVVRSTLLSTAIIRKTDVTQHSLYSYRTLEERIPAAQVTGAGRRHPGQYERRFPGTFATRASLHCARAPAACQPNPDAVHDPFRAPTGTAH